MSFVPLSELRPKEGMNLAPMIDFLFLMLAVFASLAVTRSSLKETSIELVKAQPETRAATAASVHGDQKIVHLLISETGSYGWKTELKHHVMANAEEVAAELTAQQQRGLLPQDKAKTKVLVQIDKKAPWDPVAKLLFAVREAGFDIRPVYEPERPLEVRADQDAIAAP